MIARLAGGSHGVVTRAGLLAAGVSAKEVRLRVARGTLIRVHRGVYRVGHCAPSTEASYLAAVLACGPGARLAGHAAAHLLAIVGGPSPSPRVWAPTARRVEGVIVRRCRGGLAPDERTVWRAIPVTSPARTLLDLAPAMSLDDLARAVHEARIRHRGTEHAVIRLLDRHPTAPGRARLRAAVLGEIPVTLSQLERRFRRVLADAGLPLPDETNAPAGEGRVDCRYHDPPLTIELDSYGFHASRHAWEQDRRREREAYARGDEHRRYTYGDVFEDPALMLSELRSLLARRKRPSQVPS